MISQWKKTLQMVLKPGFDDKLTEFVNGSWENSFEKNRKCRSGMVVKYGKAVVAVPANL